MLAVLLGLNTGMPVFAEEEAEPETEPAVTEVEEAPETEETEETVLEETEELVADVEEFEKIYNDAEDFTTPAVGSDGVVYEGVHYLSVGAVSRLPEETQAAYQGIADDIADQISSGRGITDVVVAVSKDGELAYGYNVPATVYGTFGTDFVLSEEEAPEVLTVEEEASEEEEALPEEMMEEPEQPEETLEEAEAAAEEETEVLPEEPEEEPELTEEPAEEETPAEEPEETTAEEITEALEEEEEVYEIVEENMDLYESFSIPEEVVQEVDGADYDTVLQDINYFYNQLNSSEKSMFKKGKSAMVSGGKNSFSVGGVGYYSYRYMADYAFRAIDALMMTYPNKFDWYSRGEGGRWDWRGTYYSGTLTVKLYKSKYYSSTLKSQMNSQVNTIVNNAYSYAQTNYPNNPTYGIVSYFDNWLCQNNYYNYDGTYDYMKNTSTYYFCHTPFGCLLKGYGVCESYALAMNALLEKAGIRSMYAVGDVTGGGHAWNYVQMSNGYWYLLDSTWNDSGSYSDKSYFLVGGSKMTDSGRVVTGTTFSYNSFSFRPDINWASSNYSSSATDSYFSQVTLSETVKVMKPKGTFTLKKILPTNVSGVGSYYSKWPVTWTSSNPAVAKVSSKGKVTAIKPGSTTISMTIGGVKKSCVVYVYKFTKLTFNENLKTSLTRTYEKSSNVYVYNNVISADFTSSDDQYVYLTVNQAADKTRTAAQIQSYAGLKLTAKSSSSATVEVINASLSGDTITLQLRPHKIGTATITVKFGGKTAKLKLSTKYQLKSEWFETQSEFSSRYPGLVYTGGAKTPKIAKSAIAPKGLKYKLTYSNNKNAGTATLTIKGTGNYAGTVTRTFTISRASVEKAKFSKFTASKTYTGALLPPTATVMLGKKTLKKGVDYQLQYRRIGTTSWTASEPYNYGTYEVRVQGLGNYTGYSTVLKQYTIK